VEHLALEVGEARADFIRGFLDIPHGVRAARHAEGFATEVDGTPKGRTLLRAHLTDFPAARTRQLYKTRTTRV